MSNLQGSGNSMHSVIIHRLVPLLLMAAAARGQTVVHAERFSGADAGEQIAQCIQALPTTGGVCDARELSGQQRAHAGFTVGGANKPVSLLLGPGTLATSGTIFLRERSSIVGLPSAAAVGSEQSPSIIKAANGSHLRAVVQIDGSFSVLQDLTVDGNRKGAPGGAVGVLVNKANRAEIFRVTAQNAPGYGIEIYSANNESCCAKISKTMAIANGAAGLHLANTADVFLSTSEFENNGTHGVELNNSPTVRIEHCDLGGNLADGILIYGTATSPLQSNREIITGNQFGNNRQYDIEIQGFDPKAKRHASTGNLITSNEFIGGDKRPDGYDAIHVTNSGENTIATNTFSATREHPYRSCIVIEGEQELKDLVNGNFCRNLDEKRAFVGTKTTVFTNNQSSR
jgi:hypothetical protein